MLSSLSPSLSVCDIFKVVSSSFASTNGTEPRGSGRRTCSADVFSDFIVGAMSRDASPVSQRPEDRQTLQLTSAPTDPTDQPSQPRYVPEDMTWWKDPFPG